MLLDFALESERSGDLPLNRATHAAAMSLDPDRDLMAVYHRAGDAESGDTESRDGGFPDPVSATTVARLLDDVHLSDPTPDLLLTCLRTTVDAARYWQRPDGTDILAGTPELRGPLERVAAHLAVSPLIDWWWSPPDLTDQWATAWNEDAGSLSTWRRAVLSAESRHNGRLERRRRPENATGGTWWSTPADEVPASTRSWPGNRGPGDGGHTYGPVGACLAEDRWEDDLPTSSFSPPPGARILHISGTDGATVWGALCRDHPCEVTWSYRHDWYLTTGRDSAVAGPWLVPDWTTVAEEWDAVHLTVAGYLAVAGTVVPVSGGDAASVVAGWGPDATYWLTTQR